MTDFMTQLDQKFEIALKHYVHGKDSIRFGAGTLGLNMEIIALDSECGPDSRCILSRVALDSQKMTFNDLDVVSMVLKYHEQAETDDTSRNYQKKLL